MTAAILREPKDILWTKSTQRKNIPMRNQAIHIALISAKGLTGVFTACPMTCAVSMMVDYITIGPIRELNFIGRSFKSCALRLAAKIEEGEPREGEQSPDP